MKELSLAIRQFAVLGAPVLIEGETGSGKELAARAIHAESAVAAGPWVDINCAALPDHLAESELFGYEKGAFSGADGFKPGLFELASGGTLFLDEIGELAPQLQSKLLRVLDRMEYFRLGGTRQVRVRTRVVAATNRRLADEVERGNFRADLYHRLSVVRVEVPPLRSRPADILPLAEGFLAQMAAAKRLDARTIVLLERYQWPGNVRELKNVIQRAVAVSAGDRIAPADLPLPIQNCGGGASLSQLAQLAQSSLAQSPLAPACVADPADPTCFSRPVNPASPAEWHLASQERRWIEAALRYTGGHQQRAATLLGVSRRTLSRKLREWSTSKEKPN